MFNIDQAAQANEYNRIYNQGKLAAIDGTPHKDNPFPTKSTQSEAWEDGWLDGKNYVNKFKG